MKPASTIFKFGIGCDAKFIYAIVRAGHKIGCITVVYDGIGINESFHAESDGVISGERNGWSIVSIYMSCVGKRH